MNKLKWFTHDNDAHENLFIEQAIDRFGHFGYAAYFMLIEVLDRHGTGDILTISRKALAKKLRCKPKSLGNVLGMFRESGRVRLEDSGEILTIEIPKFRKRQSKLKSKVRSMFPQCSPNVPQEGEGEGEGDKKEKEKKQPLAQPSTKATQREDPQEFVEWWEAYPSKVGRLAAVKIWKKQVQGKVELSKMLSILEKQKASDQWQKEGGQFIPNPATYLNQGRWDDEVSNAKSGNSGRIVGGAEPIAGKYDDFG